MRAGYRLGDGLRPVPEHSLGTVRRVTGGVVTGGEQLFLLEVQWDNAELARSMFRADELSREG